MPKTPKLEKQTFLFSRLTKPKFCFETTVFSKAHFFVLKLFKNLPNKINLKPKTPNC